MKPLNSIEQFGAIDADADDILLDGYSLTINGSRLPENGGVDGKGRPVVHPGDLVEYTLYWRALEPPPENYHGFIHLVDVNRETLVARDQLPGLILSPPRLWNSFRAQTDTYRFLVPENAAGGLYWPSVGLYRFEDRARLPIRNADGVDLGDAIDLPSLKVLNSAEPSPANTLEAKFENVGVLLGYDLELPAEGLYPGSTMTLTLTYRSTKHQASDYTQFIHLYDADLGMAAQFDTQPQGGGNPTSAWIPGEIIVDAIPLIISEEAQPGLYSLRVGLYDANAAGIRVPVHNGNGQPLVDAQVILQDLRVEQRP